MFFSRLSPPGAKIPNRRIFVSVLDNQSNPSYNPNPLRRARRLHVPPSPSQIRQVERFDNLRRAYRYNKSCLFAKINIALFFMNASLMME